MSTLGKSALCFGADEASVVAQHRSMIEEQAARAELHDRHTARQHMVQELERAICWNARLRDTRPAPRSHERSKAQQDRRPSRCNTTSETAPDFPDMCSGTAVLAPEAA